MYHIIASDLDGTLLSPNHTITSFACDTLKLIAKRINFVFATGRHHIDVIQMRNRIGIQGYMITSNGARIHNAEGILMFSKNLDKDIVRDLYTLEYNKDILMHVYDDHKWFIDGNSMSKKHSFVKPKLFNYQLVESKWLPTDGISKVFFTGNDPDHLLKMEHVIEKRWTNRVNVSLSSPLCLEVMAGGVSKGHALKNVARILNISLKKCIAFGDGMNDKEMLSIVGKGCIMANAHPRLKKFLPELEVIGSNNEDAVPYTLRQIFLQN
ncbi:sugar/pyridoxal phosphate phosphatase YigL [Candidatus Ishikawella capsulata]|uniref:Predicted hydrolase Glucosamine 6-phosphatase n=1 Tax=Candidatus Ishikawaella capsulata Mpkobe TaxID=476281 RepID=C5WDQ3_9ENTR|nr:sugar/pyridoxal phosphate phosphatase YigL [Candidatus Ishikawaella capsulata]BAH83459.1 predicted hydrolase Glucosamine 6-phosphatase [Candidatus Ishikawaella capsulata Mpkobe]